MLIFDYSWILLIGDFHKSTKSLDLTFIVISLQLMHIFIQIFFYLEGNITDIWKNNANAL